MIAERIGSEEAMDLFRHTLELTTHVSLNLFIVTLEVRPHELDYV